MTATVTSLRTLAVALEKAEAKAKELRRQRDEAIVELANQGVTTDTVAFYAGVSQPRVVQLTKKAAAASG